MPYFRHIFLVLVTTSLSFITHASVNEEHKLHLGNGIAAIAEGEIITFEQLRKSLDPIVPKLRLQAKSEAEFSKLIEQVSKDCLLYTSPSPRDA